ncbi:hypothetical protein [Chromobacterium violaceum]|uniref:hypothetical protein n=1 Tax=Chromobacterium violaceum TaxID=536 RepID=UPI001C8BBB15|nr:hypothetical protein [Chromobacterium violaceum]MBX9266811.1 hypothetical protein [Chromobacterium violaceum]
MKLSRSVVAKIRAMGLNISDEPFFSDNHQAFPNGYIISKPADIPGNGAAIFECIYRDSRGEDVLCNSPAVYVFHKSNSWYYSVSMFAPGPGPGEFSRKVHDEAEIIREIRHYFFEDSKDYQALHDAIAKR